MRTGKLVSTLLFLAACGGSKPPETVPAPPPNNNTSAPPPAGEQQPAPPAANNDAALINEAKQFVANADQELRKLYVDAATADWANQTDITPEHEAAAAKAGEVASVGVTKLIKEAKKFDPVLNKLD